jgi:hypothetical protein
LEAELPESKEHDFLEDESNNLLTDETAEQPNSDTKYWVMFFDFLLLPILGLCIWFSLGEIKKGNEKEGYVFLVSSAFGLGSYVWNKFRSR